MEPAVELGAATLAGLLAQVGRHTGIAMAQRKRPRLRALSLRGYGNYLALRGREPAEIAHFIDAVTSNDTLFFRTPHIWNDLSARFLPDWARRHPERPLRLWSAAAASGEEAYSVAILCKEFRLRQPWFAYEVLGTDIAAQTLAEAAAGRYAGRSAERLRQSRSQWHKKYFADEPGGIRAGDSLRRQVRFARHNLLAPMHPARQFDLVLLRNVLIYCDAEHQQAVLTQVRHSMAPGAQLILGESEAINRLDTPFQFESAMVCRLGAGP